MPFEWLPYMTINRDALTTPEVLMSARSSPAWVRPFRDAFGAKPDGTDVLTRFLYADVKTLLPDEMFVKADCMTMAHSIEGRVPLCDHRLVELAGRIPFGMKFEKGRGKMVMRRAVENRLPKAIMNRAKAGFEVPLSEWFRGELYPMAKDLLTDASFRQSGYFEPTVVDRVLEENRAGRQKFGSTIWALVVFELWRRSENECRL